jgi:15-cis-phytoene synthase
VTLPPSPRDSLRTAYQHCEALAREHDRDRWLSALFAPETARAHLNALAAFNYEVGRLREILREPLAGELRLTWWREALTGRREAAGHPVAEAVLETIRTFALPTILFENHLEARQFDLYDDPMPSLRDLEGYCGETSSSLFQLAALILGEGRDVGAADASGHAGVAYAITGLLRALPLTSARGQVYLPRDVLERNGAAPEDVRARRGGRGLAAALRELCAMARGHLEIAEARIAELPKTIAPAYTPLAIVPAYLLRLERTAEAPFGAIVEVPQWRRQLALWRWARGH